ncbi:tRNA nucleotidyltransferase [Rhodococcus phage NiceHouse]|nr:tRNA nucleotidyltransferase [Rhodococcus phage NiceHouse]
MIPAPLMNEVSEILGGEGYLVGGSVRDKILGRPVKDFDFCTPMLPDDIEAAVRKAGKKPHLAGKRFGTVGFKSQGEDVEITTFRTELYVPGDRKPEVQYTNDLNLDLARRDFTMNAMALDFDGNLIDPFGGQNALDDRMIHSVGLGLDRISEDPLRMLRAVRFVSQLGFDINENFIDEIMDQRHLLMTVSRERWGQELDKFMLGSYTQKGMVALKSTGLMQMMFPELNSAAGWAHSAFIGFHMGFLPLDADVRWAFLMREIGNLHGTCDQSRSTATALISEGISARMRFSNQRTKLVKENLLLPPAHKGLWN